MAGKKISELPAAGALSGNELVEVVKGGVNSQTTAKGIADLGVEHFRGTHDASSGAYPVAGTGSGIAGAIQAGDEWVISGSGTLTRPFGDMIVEVGFILKSIVNTPGSTPSNWLVIQTQ